MTNQIAEEYYQIGNFVDVITLGQSEAPHKYTTIDGWKGFRFCCPICGDRDRGKRGEMGKIAHQLADINIITDDNPRFENPKNIRKEMLE